MFHGHLPSTVWGNIILSMSPLLYLQTLWRRCCLPWLDGKGSSFPGDQPAVGTIPQSLLYFYFSVYQQLLNGLKNISYILFPIYALLSVRGLVQALKQGCVLPIILGVCVSFRKKKHNSYLNPWTYNTSPWGTWYNIIKVKTLAIDEGQFYMIKKSRKDHNAKNIF